MRLYQSILGLCLFSEPHRAIFPFAEFAEYLIPVFEYVASFGNEERVLSGDLLSGCMYRMTLHSRTQRCGCRRGNSNLAQQRTEGQELQWDPHHVGAWTDGRVHVPRKAFYNKEQCGISTSAYIQCSTYATPCESGRQGEAFLAFERPTRHSKDVLIGVVSLLTSCFRYGSADRSVAGCKTRV